jgi:hypothetical protein
MENGIGMLTGMPGAPIGGDYGPSLGMECRVLLSPTYKGQIDIDLLAPNFGRTP